VNLRTFVPPRALATAEPPALGDRAPALPDPGLVGGRSAVIAFLRHTGCPFAEATMIALRDMPGELDRVAISHAPPDATARWCEAVGGCGKVRVLGDPGRESYAAWGLGRSSLAHFMGRRSLSEVGRLAGRGIRNRHPDGTRWQQAGTFAVDARGIVRWRHIPGHAGELPDLADAAEAALVRRGRP
jgi:hypothetical protein